jgi:hypothetical protein
MKIDTAFDPASSAVLLKKLATQLNEELAPRGSPDYVRIADIITEMRLHTSEIKTWVYKKLESEPAI